MPIFNKPNSEIMEKIHVVARFKIHSDKLSEFKRLAEECVLLVHNETGADLYDWFIEDNNCTVVETYKDSDAVFAHINNVGEPLGKLMEISDFSVEVFGNVSVELQKTLSEMKVKPVPFFTGLQK